MGAIWGPHEGKGDNYNLFFRCRIPGGYLRFALLQLKYSSNEEGYEEI